MHTQHRETLCPHRIIHKHGVRRKRCAQCGKTWMRWKRKRGPKPRKKRRKALENTFQSKFTLVQQALKSHANYAAFTARHRLCLHALHKQSWDIDILPKRGKLILIIDAKWFSFKRKRYTVYLLALRPVNKETASFMPPVLCRGDESAADWRKAIDKSIPPQLRKRVCALVSDSFIGVETIAKEQDLQLQRCHFHLYSRFQPLLGRNKTTVSFRLGRQQIYRTVRLFLETTDPKSLYTARDAIRRCGKNNECPVRIRRILRELLRREDEFRTYLFCPELRLPSTTNTMENMNSQLDDLLRRCKGISSPSALLLWIHAFVRFHPTVKCRPKNLHN